MTAADDQQPASQVSADPPANAAAQQPTTATTDASAAVQSPPYAPALVRPLKIYALDPSFNRSGDVTTIELINEPLRPGPCGAQVRIVDYDSNGQWYAPVDLDDPAVLIRGGLDPSDTDPRFHQQMVYAVVMKVIGNFERALGRRLRWHGGEPLTVFPHAFRGANAFFQPATNTLHFGYYTADLHNPGPSLPGQTVFTCLSHDIVAHEATHAVVHRLRRRFVKGTNPDAPAFHEAIADIVAIFQHFSLPAVLRREIAATQADITRPGRLLELAAQFGYTTGGGKALRRAADDSPPDPAIYANAVEPHDRGSVLVAAVFDGFFRIYRGRLAESVRLATGGTGVLPPGDLPADLANVATRLAAGAAQDVLTMCLRAFEYLPPVDVTFGDFLRAMITADFDLHPNDDEDRRPTMIESFRQHGIYPPMATSLSDDALVLNRPQELDGVSLAPNVVLDMLATRLGPAHALGRPSDDNGRLASELVKFGREHTAALQLIDGIRPDFAGVHAGFRVNDRGLLEPELVAQWMQTPKPGSPHRVERGGLVLEAGATAVFSADGTVRHLAARPLPAEHLSAAYAALAAQRVEQFERYVESLDVDDPKMAWCDAAYLTERMDRRLDLRVTDRTSGPGRR